MENGANGHAAKKMNGTNSTMSFASLTQTPQKGDEESGSITETAAYNRGFAEGLRRAAQLLVGPVAARLSEQDRFVLSGAFDNVEELLHTAEQKSRT